LEGLTEKIRKFVESRGFQGFIIVMILFAGVLVGAETYGGFASRHEFLFSIFEKIIIWTFAAEAALKMASHGRNFLRYFKDPWNIFDFSIVVICFLPFSGSIASVLRLARVMRLFKLVHFIPELQLIVTTLFKSIPSIGYVGLLLVMLFYIFAVLGTSVFGANDPIHFGSLETSMLSLFRVATLEDWTDIMYINMYGSDHYGYQNYPDVERISSGHPLGAAVFFVLFVMLGTMIIMNLFIGVIMNGMEGARAEARAVKDAVEQTELTLGVELENIELQLDAMKAALQKLRDKSQRHKFSKLV